MEQWAELRRLHCIAGVSVRELSRRTGLHRTTVRRALASAEPPKYARPPAPSKLDPFKDEVHRLLNDEPHLPAVRIRELLQPLGYQGGETILKEHVREVRPFFLPAWTYQRTVYLPGELAQCDLWEPRAEIPVSFGQTRRAYVPKQAHVTPTLVGPDIDRSDEPTVPSRSDVSEDSCGVRSEATTSLPISAKLGRGENPRRQQFEDLPDAAGEFRPIAGGAHSTCAGTCSS